MIQGEAYFDIVWRQFRKHRLAVGMLWSLAALFLLAILAPLIASEQPFIFNEGGETLYPWFVALLNPPSAVDLMFNVALLVLPPWAIVAWFLNRKSKARDVPGRKRVAWFLLLFVGLLILGIGNAWQWGPKNRYFDRDFKKDHHAGTGSGVYTLIPYGPTEQDLDMILKPPLSTREEDSVRYRDGEIHLLGTDDSGRDVLVRLIYGTRIAITIGFLAVSIYMAIGIALGGIAGYFGGWVDILISRIIEIVLLFPAFFLILILVALIGPSLYLIMVVIGLTGWPTIARLIRGEFLRQRSIDYVTAARAVGASGPRIIFRHILPNALAPAFVAAPFGIAGAIVTEAGLSVLGFGVRPPAPTWGTLLNLAVGNLNLWWLTVFAGASIFFTVTVFNLVGNALRDAMDPRLKGAQ